MSFKTIAFTAFAILTITLGTLSTGSPAQAGSYYYGHPNNVADGGNG